MRRIIDMCDEGTTAREVMQRVIHEEGSELPLPRWIETQAPPPQPNAYSDGSLKNPGVGPHWMVGGIGVWWPGRTEDTLPETEAEHVFTRSEYEPGGYRAWNAFNNLRNSSTRCEIGAAIMALQPPAPVNIGIDNKTCVEMGSRIINHASAKQQADLRTPGGAPRLDGTSGKVWRKQSSLRIRTP